LPLHAAGIYPVNKQDSQICLADFVISSYTPTLTALLKASETSFETINEAVKLLVVIQPNTPNISALPGTKEELKIIHDLSEKHQILTTLEGPQATVMEVLSEMGNCSWVHLACHGQQDLKEPIKSGFVLHDDCLELSKIGLKSLPNAQFAFLSACQTATGYEEQPDEAIHLAAGMLSAGYQSVVATMWSIGDADAPFVAKAVYSKLLGGEVPSSKDAAYALHDAVKSLRESYYSQSFASWVPFIHIGV
jgi:CHAT domain-containing protein